MSANALPACRRRPGKHCGRRRSWAARCPTSAKLYWNDDLAFEENLHANFDWYHPRYAHRQTEQEVRAWCDDEGLTIEHIDVQESGITVRAVKR